MTHVGFLSIAAMIFELITFGSFAGLDTEACPAGSDPTACLSERGLWADNTWQDAWLMTGGVEVWENNGSVCDARAIQASAPLSVLFGLSRFWGQVRQHRESHELARPLEVHIIGASYPFEGRSDWSLLASRLPPSLIGIRVVLILGTPGQDDGVVRLNNALAKQALRNEEQTFVEVGESRCVYSKELAMLDANFDQARLCQQHGDNLEVLCLEDMYDDVASELPTPDVVFMFSPGFPQIIRRSWDTVLIRLLELDVPILVVDTADLNESRSMIVPGGIWPVTKDSPEDGLTLIAMEAYGARGLGAFRNPFPLLNLERGTDDHIDDPPRLVAKAAVLQAFRGLRPGSPQLRKPPPHSDADSAFLKHIDFNSMFGDEESEDSLDELKAALMIPVSSPYDRACMEESKRKFRAMLWNDRRAESLTVDTRAALSAILDKDYRGVRGWVDFYRDLSGLNVDGLLDL